MKPFPKSSAAILVVLLTTIAGLLYAFLDVMPPADLTRSSMGETFHRINLYIEKEGKTPESLDELAARPGYANRTTDGWGRKLIYTISEKGTLTLTSLGKDGKFGGTGENLDITKSK